MTDSRVVKLTSDAREAQIEAAYDFFLANSMFPVLSQAWSDLEPYQRDKWAEMIGVSEQAWRNSVKNTRDRQKEG